MSTTHNKVREHSKQQTLARDAHDKKMPHLLASISVALDALGTSCMVELCGPDMRGAHGKVRTALRRTGLEVQANRWV